MAPSSSNSVVVQKIDVFRVTPSSSNSPAKEPLELPLTFFDMFWLRSEPIDRISFYKLAESTPSFFNSVIIPPLKHSLFLTLPHFLPVAGSLVWPPHSIVPIARYTPNESSVLLTVAESNADLDRLSAHGPRQVAELHPYIPELKASESEASIVSVQITNFPNQGFCIGISSHHAILDGKSMSMFIAAWVRICRQLMVVTPELLAPQLPFYDRSTLLQAESAVELVIKKWAKMDPKTSRNLSRLPISQEKSTLSKIYLSCQDIARLKENVLRRISGLQYVSTFAVAVAYTVSAWYKAKLARDKSVLIAFSADCRNRLNPPLPPNYFGNCLDPLISQITVLELTDAYLEHDDHGVALIASKICDTIRGLDDHHEDNKSVDQKAMEICKVMVGGGDDEGIRSEWVRYEMFIVSGSPRFGYYDTDFGWGKPVKVELPSIAKNGAIFLSDGRDGAGSVEIGLALNKQEMDAFQHLFATGLKSPSNSDF